MISLGTESASSSLAILYLGPDSGTSRHRARSLSRLGHKVKTLDLRGFLPSDRITNYWVYHTGAMGVADLVRSRVLQTIGAADFDLVWVDGGDLVSPELVRDLKRHARFVVNYNIDDPFGARDGNKWRLYLRSIPFYDLVAVVRDCNVPEAYARGARNVVRVVRSADEIAHAPRNLTDQDYQRWAAEVAFIGTWMPERGGFIARLVELGVPLTVYGDRWQRAREWSILRSYWRGGGLYDDDQYARAIQCAKVNLGLLSKGNHDLVTTRSFEIPLMGGVLCAERTAEHLQLYEEGEEAVFWNTPEECASKCMQLLQDDGKRKCLATNGRMRCLQNKTTNEAIMAHILSRALRPVESQANTLVPTIKSDY